MQYVIKSFKKTITDGLFNIVIVDCNNCSMRHYTDMYNFSRTYAFTVSSAFFPSNIQLKTESVIFAIVFIVMQPYTCEMPLDLQQCLKNDIHQRSASDIQRAIEEWVDAPSHYIQLDYRPLLDALNATVTDDKMELDAISDDDQVTQSSD